MRAMFNRTILIVLMLLLMTGLGIAQEQSVTLDHVVGGIAERGVIYAGKPIEFHLRYTNLSEHCYNIVNGYKVYSPDGAQWDSLTAHRTEAWDAQESVDLIGNHVILFNDLTPIYNEPAWGDDTVRVEFMYQVFKERGSCPSLHAYFDDVALVIKIGPIDAQYVGQSICLDSSFIPPGTTWKWSSLVGPAVYPEWSGPYCFEIASCCPPGGTVGNADLDPDGVVDIADLGAMIDQLLIQNKYPVCPIAGDLEPAMFGGDFDGVVDIGDITAMIRHLFITFDPLPACPEGL